MDKMLPDDILKLISNLLDYKTLSTFRLGCKRFYSNSLDIYYDRIYHLIETRSLLNSWNARTDPLEMAIKHNNLSFFEWAIKKIGTECQICEAEGTHWHLDLTNSGKPYSVYLRLVSTKCLTCYYNTCLINNRKKIVRYLNKIGVCPNALTVAICIYTNNIKILKRIDLKTIRFNAENSVVEDYLSKKNLPITFSYYDPIRRSEEENNCKGFYIKNPRIFNAIYGRPELDSLFPQFSLLPSPLDTWIQRGRTHLVKKYITRFPITLPHDIIMTQTTPEILLLIWKKRAIKFYNTIAYFKDYPQLAEIW